MSFDLSGTLYAQKNYLYDLSAISVTTPVTGYIDSLQRNLGIVYNSYTAANTSAQGVLDHQNKMSDILKTEQDRLMAKKAQIDNEITGKQRMIDLNESYRKKQSQYIYILMILVVVLIVYICIVKIKQFIPDIPDSLIDLILIALFSFTIVYIYTLIRGIFNRDNMNYDNLKLGPPPGASNSDVLNQQRKAAQSGDLLGSIANPNICVGQNCCAVDSTWDSGIYKCIKTCPTGTIYDITTKTCIATSACNTETSKICGKSCIPQSQTCFGQESFTGLDGNCSKPYAPSEFVNYSKI
jgi:hypothetical protein